MKRFLFIFTVAITLLMGSSHVFAYETGEVEGRYTSEEIQEVRNILKEENVSEQKIDGLVYKLQKGIPWDSFNRVYAGIKPQIVKKGYEKTIYPDGSYVVNEITPIESRNDTNITPFTVYNKKGYECRHTAGVVTMAFKIDYKRNTSTHKAIITNMYEYYTHVVGGTYTVDTRGFLNGWRTETNAWYAVNVTAKDSWYSGRCFIKTYVDARGARKVTSFPGIDY